MFPRRGLRALVLSATGVVLSGLLAVPGPDAGASTPEADRSGSRSVATEGRVVHRVVWDLFERGRPGIHLRSARRDGSDVRRVFDSRRGFTLNPTLSRNGRRVAFATCCRDRFPQLVVVPVRGGTALRPLARHQHLTAVGGIGWSPNGQRLAFEANASAGSTWYRGIWTVRLDGHGLRRIVRYPQPEDPNDLPSNDALAWTDRGVLYTDGVGLQATRGGRTHLIRRGVTSLRISGDGRHLVTSRDHPAGSSVWFGNADDTDLRRVLVNDLGAARPLFLDVTPNYDGTELMAARFGPTAADPDEALVVWSTTRPPRTATTLDFLDHPFYVTWN